MSTDPDEEALRWAGDSDLDYPKHAESAAEVADGGSTDAEEEPAKPANPLLVVVYGIIGGIYVLYSVAWLITVTADPFSRDNLFAEIMAQFGEFLAIAAPLVWVAVTVLLTRDRSALLRLGWLVGGLILLFPLPYLLGGF
ncbi:MULTISPECIES: hypothetical protein [unclassified Diaminobutyricimonas]|uniref:hypothetical protein n=1 Tax=unclassified Diaminobutyricimonas TaxID=2643261 RepID=UPI0012F48811|nr:MULTISPECIES: hypothetical protein [unclassified Diaminobutyricimonas]